MIGTVYYDNPPIDGVALLMLLGGWPSVLDREFQLPLSSVQSDMCWHKICISKPSPEKKRRCCVTMLHYIFSHTLFHAPHLIVVKNRRSPSGGMKRREMRLCYCKEIDPWPKFSCLVCTTAFGWFLVTNLHVAKSRPFWGFGKKASSHLESRVSICSSLLAGCWLDLQPQRSLKASNMLFRISTWQCLGSEKAQ